MTMPSGSKAAYEDALQDIIDLSWEKMQGTQGSSWQTDLDAAVSKFNTYQEMLSWQQKLTESQGT